MIVRVIIEAIQQFLVVALQSIPRRRMLKRVPILILQPPYFLDV
jgi:hypothetical protein